MPELIIKYKNKKTLKALLDFSKYFDFSVILPPESKTNADVIINGVAIIPADSSINTSDLEKIYTGKNIDAKQLRKDSWQRIK